MNITELARILKITPHELKDRLPQFGFDIGQKAIKINHSIANKIIKDWPRLRRQIERQRELEHEREQAEERPVVTNETIRLPQYITVKDFAATAKLPVNTILTELMKNGIIASLNEKIDFETAWLVGSELGLKIKLAQDTAADQESGEKTSQLKEALGKEKQGDLLPRPPVIVVMGHVDHGKTKLLDAIRKTDVVAGEAGGITQHIGAYQVVRNNQTITFIDTPGHEAFTAMRSRGARIADIAILVVAADDGVKPQTIEAFRIIEKAKIPFVVAINKIDKPGANIDKTKQELANQLKITPEDWGGKTICAPISALQGTGISELLDMVLLVAETESQSMTANPNSSAIGTIIESNIDKGAGPVATLLIQNGTLRTGDNLIFDSTIVGKVRGLKDYRGEQISAAGPSTPVRIIGLKTMPKVGDILTVGNGERIKFKKAKSVRPAQMSTMSMMNDNNNDENSGQTKTLNLIIKSDVLGSAEAIEESLVKINTQDVKAVIIHKGLGNVSDGDIKRAEATGAIILGFNIKLPPAIEEMAREKKIDIRQYSIIYDLLNDIKIEMEKIIEPEITSVETGRVKVLAVFRTEKNEQIIGGKISSGTVNVDAAVKVSRQNEIIAEGKIIRLQSGKQNVNSATSGEECGLQYHGDPVIKDGDVLIAFRQDKTVKKL